MISDNDLKHIIEEVLHSFKATQAVANQDEISQSDDILPDLTAVDLKKELLVPDPHNREMYMQLKESTSARVGIWRSGPRPLTRSLLRFRADHAIAQDAVFSNVSDACLESMELKSIQSCCKDKDEFLTRPDLGRRFDDKNIAILKDICPANASVQIFVADGLSSTAVEANAKDALLSIKQGLKSYDINVGTPFFVKFGRVPCMDMVSEILNPTVTVLLIGERPGLATGESLSCYMAYKASTTMPEANRTVISNIHNDGTPAVEAGAHIAEVIKKMLEQKASGLELKQ